MKLRILSDLYLEFHPDAGRAFVNAMEIEPDEVLIVAGGLALPSVLAQSLAFLCARFSHVVFVAGDHEYLAATPTEVHDIIRAATVAHDNLHWLESAAVMIDGQLFVGATPWFTEHACVPPDCLLPSKFQVANRFETWVHLQHERALAYLNETVTADDVVITPHLATRRLAVPIVCGPSSIRTHLYELTPLILARQPKLWVHGNSRAAVDHHLGVTRIVANPGRDSWQQKQTASCPDLRVGI